MKIKEIEVLTGMSRDNIRFYERCGLLEPYRNENGYREYSDENVLTLKKIKLLRTLHISIDDIKGEEFTFAHFQTLEKEGFLIGSIFTDTIYYYLTSKAVDYFSEKKKSIEADKKEKSIVTRRYWLDKIIPFAALLISAIALLNSIFKWWQA